MSLNWETTRNRLLRAMREGPGGECTVTVILSAGKITGKVTAEHPPQQWTTGEIILMSRSRLGTEVHIISSDDALAVTVMLP